jgi:hypothetical protein
MGLRERGLILEIAAQLVLDGHGVERRQCQTVEHRQFRAHSVPRVAMALEISGRDTMPGMESFLGGALGQVGQQAGQYAIFSQLANSNPIAQRMAMWDPVMGTGPNPNYVPGYGPGSSFADYYRHLSPRR